MKNTKYVEQQYSREVRLLANIAVNGLFDTIQDDEKLGDLSTEELIMLCEKVINNYIK